MDAFPLYTSDRKTRHSHPRLRQLPRLHHPSRQSLLRCSLVSHPRRSLNWTAVFVQNVLLASAADKLVWSSTTHHPMPTPFRYAPREHRGSGTQFLLRLGIIHHQAMRSPYVFVLALIDDCRFGRPSRQSRLAPATLLSVAHAIWTQPWLNFVLLCLATCSCLCRYSEKRQDVRAYLRLSHAFAITPTSLVGEAVSICWRKSCRGILSIKERRQQILFGLRHPCLLASELGMKSMFARQLCPKR